MGIIAQNNTTYEVKPDQIKALIAADLGVDISKVSIRFIIQGSGYDFRGEGGISQVTRIDVTVVA